MSNSWLDQSNEERALLNPSFCATLLWLAASGYSTIDQKILSFEETFLVLPFCLHRETRGELPITSRTSFTYWLETHPLFRSKIATRAKNLVPFTKAGIVFGGNFELFSFNLTRIQPNPKWKRDIDAWLLNSSPEINECARKAQFIGKWLANAGTPQTIFALLGVRP